MAREDGTEATRICVVFYDMQDFGGLEEYAVNLAIALRRLGHQTSVLSGAWVPRDNQSRRRLAEHHVPLVQVWKRISLPASDRETKLAILTTLICLASPLVCLLGTMHWLVKRSSWPGTRSSEREWLREQLLRRTCVGSRLSGGRR